MRSPRIYFEFKTIEVYPIQIYFFLQEEIVSLQKTRASLAQELVNLSNLVEELQDKVEKYDAMKENYQVCSSAIVAYRIKIWFPIITALCTCWLD